jgi:hypothetical protein
MKTFIYGILGIGIGSFLSWKAVHSRLDQTHLPSGIQPSAYVSLEPEVQSRISVLEKDLEYYRNQYKNLVEIVLELSNRKPPVFPTTDEIWEELESAVFDLIVSEISHSEQKLTRRISLEEIDSEYLQDVLQISPENAEQVLEIRQLVQEAYLNLLSKQASGHIPNVESIDAAILQLQSAAQEELALLLSPEELEVYNQITSNDLLDTVAENDDPVAQASEGIPQSVSAEIPNPETLENLGNALDKLGAPLPQAEAIQFERIPIQTGRFNRSNRHN